jgi:hypothetical protein
VLSQSGAFRQRMAGSLEPNSLAQMYLSQTRKPVRFYLDAGLDEPAPGAQLPLYEIVLDETNTAGNRHFRGTS